MSRGSGSNDDRIVRQVIDDDLERRLADLEMRVAESGNVPVAMSTADEASRKVPGRQRTRDETRGLLMRAVMDAGQRMMRAGGMRRPGMMTGGLPNVQSPYRRPGQRNQTPVGGFRDEAPPPNTLPAVISTGVFDPNRRIEQGNTQVEPKWMNLSDVVTCAPGPMQDQLWHMGMLLFSAIDNGKSYIEAALQAGVDPADGIRLLANFGGTMPNPEIEIRAVEAWIAKHAVRVETPDMDFTQTFQGYRPAIRTYVSEHQTWIVVAEHEDHAPMRSMYIYVLPVGRGVHLNATTAPARLSGPEASSQRAIATPAAPVRAIAPPAPVKAPAAPPPVAEPVRAAPPVPPPPANEVEILPPEKAFEPEPAIKVIPPVPAKSVQGSKTLTPQMKALVDIAADIEVEATPVAKKLSTAPAPRRVAGLQALKQAGFAVHGLAEGKTALRMVFDEEVEGYVLVVPENNVGISLAKSFVATHYDADGTELDTEAGLDAEQVIAWTEATKRRKMSLQR
jgi:hypothetical protein